MMTLTQFEKAAACTPLSGERLDVAKKFLVEGVKSSHWDGYDAGNCEWIKSMDVSRRINRSLLMKAAWKFARDYARVYGGPDRKFIGQAMKKAWSMNNESLAYFAR